jgi:hypothetical protein
MTKLQDKGAAIADISVGTVMSTLAFIPQSALTPVRSVECGLFA